MRQHDSPRPRSRARRLGATLALPALIAAMPAVAMPLISTVQIAAEPYPGQLPRLNPASICQGEVLEVAVTTQHPAGPGNRVWVEIDGYPGDTRYLQFGGDPGPRHIFVLAATDDGDLDSRTIQIDVAGCEITAIPEVRSRFNPYRPLTADFVVTPHETLAADFTDFFWDFGDGTTGASRESYVSHSYADSVDGSEPVNTFAVMVSSQPIVGGVAAPTAMTRRYTVAVQDPYFHSKQRGIIQPRVATSGRMERRGAVLVGSYSVENLESEPIIYQYAEIEELACDTRAPSRSTAVLASDILFQGGYGIGEDEPDAWDTPEMQAAMALKASLGGLPDDTFVVPPVVDPDHPQSLSSALAPPAAGSRATAGRASATTVNLNLPPVPPPPPNGPSGFLVIPPLHEHAGFLTLEAAGLDTGTCVVAYHLVGQTESGLRVYTDLYFEARESLLLSAMVSDPQMVDFLFEVLARGWVDDPAEITSGDLYRLEMEGQVRRTENGWEVR